MLSTKDVVYFDIMKTQLEFNSMKAEALVTQIKAFYSSDGDLHHKHIFL